MVIKVVIPASTSRRTVVPWSFSLKKSFFMLLLSVFFCKLVFQEIRFYSTTSRMGSITFCCTTSINPQSVMA